MPNPLNNLFSQIPQQNNNFKNLENIKHVVSILKNGNPEQIAINFMKTNPEFSKFMKSVEGKTPQQFAKENGLDFSKIMEMIK